MPTPIRAAWSVLVFAGAAIGFAAPSAADPATLAWTAFLYDAPSSRARVVDEPPQGTAIDLGACADGWCRAIIGRSAGYLREEVVARAGPPARLANPAADGVGAPSGPCFEAGLSATAEPPASTRYCPR